MDFFPGEIIREIAKPVGLRRVDDVDVIGDPLVCTQFRREPVGLIDGL